MCRKLGKDDTARTGRMGLIHTAVHCIQLMAQEYVTRTPCAHVRAGLVWYAVIVANPVSHRHKHCKALSQPFNQVGQPLL